MFREELADLKDEYLGRFDLAHILTRDHQECELFNGRITAEKCQALLRQAGPFEKIDEVFICGPQEMSEALSAKLKALGVPEDHIKVELFNAAPTSRPRTVVAAAAAPVDDCEVTIQVDGRQRVFSMASAGPNRFWMRAAARDRTALFVQERGVRDLPV